MTDTDFYMDKRVFVTGHTGFKGAWLCRMLALLGAKVTGYSLRAESGGLYELADAGRDAKSIEGDVRDLDGLRKAVSEAQPEIVIHMAAQPIVRRGYREPAYTYETNVMGTVNILESVRHTGSVKSFLNVTTDKVYLNREWPWGYREDDALDGSDPYSNSKSCSELVTHGYEASFFRKRGLAVSTARAGNVLGGGDFSADRIIPDCVRAVMEDKPIRVRNPYSTRPYQHVLDALGAYLLIARRQYETPNLGGSYNIGPDDSGCFQTGALVDLFVKKWGDRASWINISEKDAPHESCFLKLDCSKIKSTFGWRPKWNLEYTVEKTVEWTKSWLAGEDVQCCTDRQIKEFMQTGAGSGNEG